MQCRMTLHKLKITNPELAASISMAVLLSALPCEIPTVLLVCISYCLCSWCLLDPIRPLHQSTLTALVHLCCPTPAPWASDASTTSSASLRQETLSTPIAPMLSPCKTLGQLASAASMTASARHNEDKASAQCAALNIPPCNVTGCGLCSPTNSSACQRCWAGFVLNVDSRECQCAPGYYGTTSCSKCPAGAVSYVGKLPLTSCITCPTGRVANDNQTECVGECGCSGALQGHVHAGSLRDCPQEVKCINTGTCIACRHWQALKVCLLEATVPRLSAVQGLRHMA